MALPAPRSLTSPYIPESTYATASPIVISTPSNFCAPFNSARSFRTLLSTSIILDPAKSCITRPEVTIGESRSFSKSEDRENIHKGNGAANNQSKQPKKYMHTSEGSKAATRIWHVEDLLRGVKALILVLQVSKLQRG
ncbi:hypothetical protein SUGI_0019080 [Cryptomeria japonica]|nr:hypothetical protein SUGI_0019080 [Cryptomeria japonica]